MRNYNDEIDDEVLKLPSPVLSPQHFLDGPCNAAIIQNIAGFLSISDAQSITSWSGIETPSAAGNVSQAGGTPYQWTSTQTLPTPALVAISPNPPDDLADFPYYGNRLQDTSLMMEGKVEPFETEVKSRTSLVQEKLASAVFSHPDSIRSFCVDAYLAAKEVKLQQSQNTLSVNEHSSPETLVEPTNELMILRLPRKSRKQDRILFISTILEKIFDNVPLSVALDVLGAFREVVLDTSFATVRITSRTIQGIVDAVVRLLERIWNTITHVNPLEFVQAIVTRPFNAMGKTTEVVVSGIQSVATGVGSASSLAFHRLSAKTASSSSLAQQGVLFRGRLGSPNNKKLIRKLSSMHAAASVISYTELPDDAAGLSKRMKSRVQRMMHYDVSLRPFVATVKLPPNEQEGVITNGPTADSMVRRNSSFSRADGSDSLFSGEDVSITTSPESPFMCTPQSFPPTPSSRRMVLARGTRFADDVIFLARDQLRVHDALDSDNERTREMAMALTQGKRLAVFDADDASAGIDLTCGQHVATKVGSMLYCSTRSMVPILRNCFVYFEMTVLPRPSGNLIPRASMATLSVGLSTKEMPPNTLVGAWKGSVGLCTTGQILTAGQWCSPVDPGMSSFGDRSTVGCLVCLDDGSAFETWDGVMVTAAVTFNVNGSIVSPPVSTMPIASVNTGRSAGTSLTPVGSPTDLGQPTMSSSVGSTSATSTPPLHISRGPFAFTLPLLVPAEEELFPTVTLHSPGVAVMCRFSLGDITATSREAIGAPPGVAVYCVDGSVILNEND